ncbi:bifunctional diaminohydroxyphosphoribosylaminopyrimidine deaminase/5-amino-6-(5-phosphoribosylamino)uracil reductase RibD [Pelagibacterium montanilacus]|uniref:bifunctional diaminohydroxyphosphoribosylaminopyrimidine deaminase/5-amino-6-(5-phosphoribosylamino)uracil reductase RibD n=1 Tax=Pelagibacterium montanilacus TaxID=2185280 RepID=UPI000F8F298A|nr:bifunctional diaminohydroxyphosphoribosylaminopyrimidine deaminase/5-amino-6-(5-phosphoribosylamino)uracil reductase RibD [Pelagibacterium montanilacus]
MTAIGRQDLRWLDAAARLAMPYRGTTAENPTVGAIVVAQGRVVGRGVTAPGGRPHAEVLALELAGEAARGATLYVTLEPCAHWGRTPPCADATIAAGVARVVCGAKDPDPRTAGTSIARMRDAGLIVDVGVALPSVETLHEGFFSRMRRGRPFVSVKLAVSPDGYIGRPDAPNVPITGEAARAWTHMQRAMADAVAVGGITARTDNPRLSVRLAGLKDRQPLRVVFSGRHELPANLNLFAKNAPQETVVIADSAPPPAADDGIAVLAVRGTDGRPGLREALGALARMGVSSVLVEGGAALAGALLEEGLVDRYHLLEGAVAIGAGGVRATVHSSLPERLRELGLSEVDRVELGCDRLRTFEWA